jgi:hypothetical protein
MFPKAGEIIFPQVKHLLFQGVFRDLYGSNGWTPAASIAFIASCSFFLNLLPTVADPHLLQPPCPLFRELRAGCTKSPQFKHSHFHGNITPLNGSSGFSFLSAKRAKASLISTFLPWQ